MSERLTAEELDTLLESFDQTAHSLQREIVGQLVLEAQRLRAAIGRHKKESEPFPQTSKKNWIDMKLWEALK